MHTQINFKMKRELEKALARGDRVKVFTSGPLDNHEIQHGNVELEGPHYPDTPTWAASGYMQNGKLVLND